MASSIWATISNNSNMSDSVVDFPTKTRFHIALNVKNVKHVEEFYSTLFGMEPHTSRDGYIKYDIDEPPLNISLNEVPKNASGGGFYGIQSKSKDEISTIKKRLLGLDFQTIDDPRADKDIDFIAVDPEGNKWDVSLFEM